MSREYANIITAIWRDPAFRALPSSQQRTYLLLVTQPDISAAGTLDLTIKRWAGLAPDTDRASIEADLKGLEAEAFVFADEDTEELLVRTFVKHDNGYGNRLRRPVILRAARAVESARLRDILVAELVKLGLPADLSDSESDARSRRRTPAPSSDPSDGTSYAASDSPSDRAYDAASDTSSASSGVVVTVIESNPQPATLNPQPHSAAPSVAASAPPPPAPAGDLTVNQRAKRITDAYAAAEPLCKWPAVNGIVIRAIKSGRCTDEQVHDALLRMAADNRPVTIDSLRVEVFGPPAPRAVGSALATTTPRPATTDLKVAAGQELAARLRAQEGGVAQ